MAIPKIVIVEDEMIIAQDIKQILVNMGYEVPSITVSGEDALQKIKTLRPDLVLMDIKLKGDMNGIEAAGQAHALYDIPVVYMTANADENTIERAKKTEPYGFVYKPVQKDVLRAIIEMALYKHDMEKKLIEREALLKATINSIGDGVISTDTRGQITSINPVAEKLTGWKFNDAEGRPLSEVFNIVNALTGKTAVNPVKRVLKSGMIVGLANHTKLIAKSGTEYQIADCASPIRSADGNVSGVVLVFRDVTEEYRIQEALQKSEDRLSKIIIAANDGTWDWNLTTNEVYFDPRYYEMAGYSVDEFPHDLEEFQKRVHPDDIGAVMDTIEKHLKGELERFRVEFRFKKKNGERMWIMGRGVIVERDGNGIPLRFVGTHTDITERKQAEERINYLNLILRSVRDVNQLITKEKNREVLLQESCKILTRDKGYENVWIALFDENHQFNFAAESGIGENFQILINDLKKGKLPFCIKNALNQKDLFLINNTEIDCADCPVHSENKSGSAVSVRLEYNRQIYGVLCAKAEKDYLLNEEILGLFKEVAGDIAYALYRLELEADHKKAEDIIRENEKFMTSLFESVQDGVSVLKPDLTILHVNGIMNKWYKKNLPLEGKKCYEVYHNADKPCDPCPTLRCLESGKTEWNVVPGLPGSVAEWIELFSYPLKDMTTGKVTGVIEYVRDITERVKTEKIQKILFNISSAVNTNDNIQDLYNKIRKSIGEAIDTTNFFIALYDEKTDMISLPFFIDKKDNYKTFPAGKTLTKYVIKNKKSFLATKSEIKNLVKKEILETIGSPSEVWLGVPLKIGNKVIGAIVVQSYHDPNLYTEKDIKILEFVSREIATAISRKQAEQALRESENKYRNLFESIGDAIFIHDLNLNILDANTSACEIYGYTKEQLKCMNVNQIDPAQRVISLGRLEKTKKQGHFSFETVHISKKGDEIIVEVNSKLINFKGETLVLSICRDIGKRKKIEKELSESEEKYRKAFITSPDSININRMKDGLYVTINEGFTKIMGYTEKDIIGKTSLELNIWQNSEDRKKLVRGLRKDGLVENLEAKFCTKNGDVKDGLMSATVIHINGEAYILSVTRDITEHKHIEEALKLSEERFRKLSNLTFEGILIHNKGVVIDLNQSLTSMFGYTREEVIGKNIIELCIPEKYHVIVKENIIKNYTKPYEVMARNKDGTLFPIEIESRDVKYNDEEFRVTAIRDISERKLAEEALRESEEHYRAVVENSHDGILIVGENYKFEYVNDTMCGILGREREEVIGHDFRGFLDEEGKKLVAERYLKRQAGEDVPSRYEFSIVRKNGNKRLVEISSTVVKDSHNNVKTIAQILDITERKQAEEALRGSEHKFNTYVNHSPGGIFIVDSKGNYVDVNEAAIILTGYSREELLNMAIPDLTVHGPSQKKTELFSELKKTGKIISEIQIKRKDGEIIWSSLDAVKLSDDRYLAYCFDITDRKQAEEQIQQDLKEKEVLLKEVHHRVKNNLSVIASLLSLQSNRISTKEQAIEAFKESKDRIYAMAMVQEKLYQSGNYSEINMKEYTESLALKLEQIYGLSKVVINFNIDDISVDINRAIPCGLILNELITNALKHAFKGVPRGEISISFSKLKSGQYKVIVRDNGIGLPDEIEVKKSNSLGLRLISILTEQLEGELTIKVSKGTEFKIVFPMLTE